MYLPTGADITEQGLNYLGVVGATASYTMVFTDDLVVVYGYSGVPVTITLPTAVGIQGRVLRVKNISGSVVTMAAFDTQLIDNVAPSATKVLFNDCLWFVAISGGWWIV